MKKYTKHFERMVSLLQRKSKYKHHQYIFSWISDPRIKLSFKQFEKLLNTEPVKMLEEIDFEVIQINQIEKALERKKNETSCINPENNEY